MKHPRTPPTNPSVDYPSADSDHVSKRTRPIGMSDEVILHITYANIMHDLCKSCPCEFLLITFLLTILHHFVQGNLPVNVLSATFPGHGHGHGQAFNSPEDLPKTVMRTLNQGSSPMSMDFHPVQQTLLLGQLLFQSLLVVLLTVSIAFIYHLYCQLTEFFLS